MTLKDQKIVDISREVYGKYMSGFTHWGLDYSDQDESSYFYGKPKWGSLPAPRHKDRRPWRGTVIELIRHAFGKRL